jgi:Predicted transcriptional regulators
MDAQLKKGVLEMCILYKLKDEPLYGYELMKSVRLSFPEVYEGTIYTILRRLNASGYASITKIESPNGPARKYYHLTEEGQAYLNRMIREWKELVENVAAIGIRV